MSENSNALTPMAKPARSHTMHQITSAGDLVFEIVPYLIGDKVRAVSHVAPSAAMTGVVTSYDGHTVTLKIEKSEGQGKFDDWILSINQSAIPAPISPDETEAQRKLLAEALDPVGGGVVCDFAKSLVELVRTMDDERDLLHYMTSVKVVSLEHEFRFKIFLEEKNCKLDPAAVAELQAAINEVTSVNGRRLRHLDLKPTVTE